MTRRRRNSAQSKRWTPHRTPVRWMRPSDADPDRQLLDAVLYEEVEQVDVELREIAGSTARGLILHKLMEELLTGEVEETARRCRIAGAPPAGSTGLSGSEAAPDAAEIAATALRTLAFPAVAEIAGAISCRKSVSTRRGKTGRCWLRAAPTRYAGKDGQPSVVFDWKSDVAPSDADRLAYRGSFLNMRGPSAQRGAPSFT